jgi:membrane protein required for colicin V production
VCARIGWIAAFVIAGRYAGRLAGKCTANLPGGALTQLLLAFVIIVVAVMVGSGVLGALFGRLAELLGLKGVDRSLGVLFGVVRGVFIVLMVVGLAGLTELPNYPFWQDALLRPYAEQGVQVLKRFLPDALAPYIRSQAA